MITKIERLKSTPIKDPADSDGDGMQSFLHISAFNRRQFLSV